MKVLDTDDPKVKIMKYDEPEWVLANILDTADKLGNVKCIKQLNTTMWEVHLD